jgi:hypothetical protein
MKQEEVEQLIEHYGVKGMRWGVRRKRPKSSADSSSVSRLLKKKPRQLSDAELKKINNRLNLERQFSSLNPSKTAKGKKFVSSILSNAGKTVLTSAVAAGLTLGGKALIEYAKKKR